MSLVGQAERQGVGVVVDLAELGFTFVDGFVVVQAGGQAQDRAVAQHMAGAEVVLVPQVFGLGAPQAGGQAGERLVGDTGGVDVIRFGCAVAVFGTELALALFGTRRVTVEGAEVEGEVFQLFAVQGHTFEARRQGTVTDDIHLRAAEILATSRQCGVGDACLDVGQAQFAPLINSVTAIFSQRTVVTTAGATWLRRTAVAGREVFTVTVQGNGVVGGDFGAEAYSAFGEARVVLDDRALHPVDAAVSRVSLTIITIVERRTPLERLIRIPVTRGAGDRLPFNKAGGFALGALFLDGDRCESLTLGLSVGRGGNAADGQGQ
ncbi:hypothetical protein D3C84_720220 [compost metagenome]